VAEKVTPFSLEENDMNATVDDIIKVLDEIAPEKLAQNWDNPGLQVGDRNWRVEKIMISLDPTPGVVQHAAEASADMLITHHPLIFQPLKQVDLASPVGSVIGNAVRNAIAVYAAHTNLDSVADGLNDMLAACLGLRNVTALAPDIEHAAEGVDPETNGLGRVGELPEPTDLLSLCRTLKKELNLDNVRIAGYTTGKVSRVALCTGSGGGILSSFFRSGADVFITGDVRYHEARDVEDRQSAMIDIGHFGSEHIMVSRLGLRLRKMLAARHPGVEVLTCEIEKDPFVVV
jgi:dinuclear metal center YbgI/SA1388 family protein